MIDAHDFCYSLIWISNAAVKSNLKTMSLKVPQPFGVLQVQVTYQLSNYLSNSAQVSITLPKPILHPYVPPALKDA